MCLSVGMSVCLPGYLSVSVCLCLCICLFVHLFCHLASKSAYLSVCLYVGLSTPSDFHNSIPERQLRARRLIRRSANSLRNSGHYQFLPPPKERPPSPGSPSEVQLCFGQSSSGGNGEGLLPGLYTPSTWNHTLPMVNQEGS